MCLFMIDVSGGVFFLPVNTTRDTQLRNAARVRLFVSTKGKGETGSTVFLKPRFKIFM